MECPLSTEAQHSPSLMSRMPKNEENTAPGWTRRSESRIFVDGVASGMWNQAKQCTTADVRNGALGVRAAGSLAVVDDPRVPTDFKEPTW